MRVALAALTLLALLSGALIPPSSAQCPPLEDFLSLRWSTEVMLASKKKKGKNNAIEKGGRKS